MIVFDSGSMDGSVDLIRRARPRHFIQLSASEYYPGRVMNYGMVLARSGYGIFLNADATPQGEIWLRPLVEALKDSGTAAVFSRQVPRPDCCAVYACDYERCFGEKRESAGWAHFFSMVSSGLRKEIWAQRGFLETLRYAEDDEYTRWCRAAGYRVLFCPTSVVMHSHNYSAQEAYRRSYGDARALAASWPGDRTDFNWRRTLLLGWCSDVRHDVRFCWRQGRMHELAHAARIRWRQRRGKLDGFRAGWDSHRTEGK